MITDTEYAPHLDDSKKHIFMCDHLELAITDDQLTKIIRLHNKGYDLFYIADRTRRHVAEVIIALLHQATVANRSHNRIKEKVTRPILYRKKERDIDGFNKSN